MAVSCDYFVYNPDTGDGEWHCSDSCGNYCSTCPGDLSGEPCIDPLSCDACGNCGNYHGGCTDSGACNYDGCANYDDGSCVYNDCAGICGGGTQTDNCGSCGNYHGGCTDSGACNYDLCANYDDGSCNYSVDHCGQQCGSCYTICDHGICGCFDVDGCGCNLYANYDALGYTCGPANCFDSSACGRDDSGNCLYADCANTCGGSATNDALGYCNGDAVQDCGGNYYSPSNEQGYTDHFTDAYGTTCSYSSDTCGLLNTIYSTCVCCNNPVCTDWSACNQDSNGNCIYNDCAGTCGGNAIFDSQNVCGGNCWDSMACGEDSNGNCLYIACDGSCISSTPNPVCFSHAQSMIGQMIGIPSFINLGSPKPRVDLSALLGIPILQ
jgi:hypothetical protein